jgi:hypothetical protein
MELRLTDRYGPDSEYGLRQRSVHSIFKLVSSLTSSLFSLVFSNHRLVVSSSRSLVFAVT